MTRACVGSLLFAVAWAPASAAPLGGRQVADDIFYMYMPIAWRESTGDLYGDFGGMTASLDYLEYLGVTAVWMTPIFPSPAYHGYQHGAGDQINPRFGTEADFWAFVNAAHARSIKVFIDFVVYGVSHDSVWYQDAYNNPGSVYDDWFSFTNGNNTQSDLSFTYNTWNGDTVGFIHWNLNNPGATNMITGWAFHWLDPNGDGDPTDGVDGFRLDHVSAYHPQESPWGYDIAWWEAWKASLLAVNPDVFTFAEQANWGSHGADLLSAHDAAMTKPFEFAARSALSNETATGLYSEMLATLATLPAGGTYLATIGDHDVDRIASVIGGSLEQAKAAAAVLMTQPFPPVLYFGDEIGMLGTKQDYGSDANDIPMREPFKWNAVAGPPMPDYHTEATNPVVYTNPFSQDNDGRSVEEQQGDPNSLLETYRSLITTRKTHAALRQGTYHEVSNSGTRVWSFVRHLAGQETLLVAVNLRGTTQAPALNMADYVIAGGTTTVQDVETGAFLANLTDANKAAYPLSVPAYGRLILAVNVTPPAPQAQVIDGRDIPTDLGPGSLLATQDNATGLGDNINELNQWYVRVGSNGLDVGLTGNLGTDATALMLFFDSVPGGQNVLQTSSFPTPPGTMPAVNGTILDAGFSPDVVVHINSWAGTIYVDHYTLASGGGGNKRYIGAGTVNDLDGFLSGGSNPNGMLIAINNGNTAGVTATDATAAGTATSGIEGFLPFADLSITGPPAGTVKMMAMLVRSSGEIGNQFLPGLGGGYGNLGFSPVDLTAVPGDQFTTRSLVALPGDWDGDGDVDLVDYGHLADCLTGPTGGALGPGCGQFDFDADLDLDLADAAQFQSLFTG